MSFRPLSADRKFNNVSMKLPYTGDSCLSDCILIFFISLFQLKVSSAPVAATEEAATLKKVETVQSAAEESVQLSKTVTSTEKVSEETSVQTATVVQAAPSQEPAPSGVSPYHAAEFSIPIGPDFSLVTGLFIDSGACFCILLTYAVLYLTVVLHLVHTTKQKQWHLESRNI